MLGDSLLYIFLFIYLFICFGNINATFYIKKFVIQKIISINDQHDRQKNNLIRTKIYINCQGSSINIITVLQGENYLWLANGPKTP